MGVEALVIDPFPSIWACHIFTNPMVWCSFLAMDQFQSDAKEQWCGGIWCARSRVKIDCLFVIWSRLQLRQKAFRSKLHFFPWNWSDWTLPGAWKGNCSEKTWNGLWWCNTCYCPFCFLNIFYGILYIILWSFLASKLSQRKVKIFLTGLRTSLRMALEVHMLQNFGALFIQLTTGWALAVPDK